MSPGRVSEPTILASADSGCQTASGSPQRSQSSGQPETSEMRIVSAVDICSGSAAEVLDYVNCAAILIWLNQQNHFIVRIFLIVIQVLDRAIKLQPEPSSFQPSFCQEMSSTLLVEDQLGSVVPTTCRRRSANGQLVNPFVCASDRKHANSGSRAVQCLKSVGAGQKAARTNNEVEGYLDDKSDGWRFDDRRANLVCPQSQQAKTGERLHLFSPYLGGGNLPTERLGELGLIPERAHFG